VYQNWYGNDGVEAVVMKAIELSPSTEQWKTFHPDMEPPAPRSIPLKVELAVDTRQQLILKRMEALRPGSVVVEDDKVHVGTIGGMITTSQRPMGHHTKYWYYLRKRGRWYVSQHHPHGDEEHVYQHGAGLHIAR
jgi:hypothetical protein